MYLKYINSFFLEEKYYIYSFFFWNENTIFIVVLKRRNIYIIFPQK